MTDTRKHYREKWEAELLSYERMAANARDAGERLECADRIASLKNMLALLEAGQVTVSFGQYL